MKEHMNIVLYSTGCPRCQVLEAKLRKKGIEFTINSDEKKMKELGMTFAPCLQTEVGLLDFKQANEWLNNYKA